MSSLEEIKKKAWNIVAREQIDYWTAVCVYAEDRTKFKRCAKCPGIRKYALCEDFKPRDYVQEPRDFFTVFSRMLREARR